MMLVVVFCLQQSRVTIREGFASSYGAVDIGIVGLYVSKSSGQVPVGKAVGVSRYVGSEEVDVVGVIWVATNVYGPSFS
jgi:hypothetical protein